MPRITVILKATQRCHFRASASVGCVAALSRVPVPNPAAARGSLRGRGAHALGWIERCPTGMPSTQTLCVPPRQGGPTAFPLAAGAALGSLLTAVPHTELRGAATRRGRRRGGSVSSAATRCPAPLSSPCNHLSTLLLTSATARRLSNFPVIL